MSAMKDIERVLTQAWWRIRPTLVADPDELNRRLQRRRTPLLTRPIRPWCIALRANDRRISAWNAIMIPDHADDTSHGDHRGRYLEHTITVDKRLCCELVGPVDLTEWRGTDLPVAAKKLGTSDRTLMGQRRTGKLESHHIRELSRPIKGSCGITVWSADRVRDPCARGMSFDPPDWVWGNTWQSLGECLSEAFEQTVTRVPVASTAGLHRGWRWVCPACRRQAASIFLPVRMMSIVEYLNDESLIVRSDADRLEPAPASFACCDCHRIRYWSRTFPSHAWNTLVAYMSGGLLYGTEVEKLKWWRAVRKRSYAPHAAKRRRGDEVERLLISGLRYEDAAREMGVKLSTVQGHVKRLYKLRNVHSKRQLQEAARRRESFAGSPSISREAV